MGPDGPPVLPLPGGTMNMLHQRVHGGIADWQTCLVEAVLRRRPEIIPAVRVNDKLVFIGAMIGRLTGLAKARETIRDGDLASLPETLDLQKQHHKNFLSLSNILFDILNNECPHKVQCQVRGRVGY